MQPHTQQGLRWMASARPLSVTCLCALWTTYAEACAAQHTCCTPQSRSRVWLSYRAVRVGPSSRGLASGTLWLTAAQERVANAIAQWNTCALCVGHDGPPVCISVRAGQAHGTAGAPTGLGSRLPPQLTCLLRCTPAPGACRHAPTHSARCMVGLLLSPS